MKRLDTGHTTDQLVLFAWLDAMCTGHSLLAGLFFVSVFVSPLVSLFVSVLPAEFEFASLDALLVSPLELLAVVLADVLAVVPADVLVDELLPNFEFAALSFL